MRRQRRRRRDQDPPLARPGEYNSAFVDGFTFVHAATGALLGRAGVSAPAALGVALVWESVEPDLKRKYRKAFPSATRDRMRNKAGDVLGFVAGWVLGQRSRTR